MIRWSKQNQITLFFLNPRITRITYFLPRITDRITRITALALLLRANGFIVEGLDHILQCSSFAHSEATAKGLDGILYEGSHRKAM